MILDQPFDIEDSMDSQHVICERFGTDYKATVRFVRNGI